MTQSETRPTVLGQPAGEERPNLGRSVLRSIGLEALVEFLETTSYGVCITGDDHTWVYLNPAAERIVGARLGELRGRDYLLHFPEHERAALLALEGEQREGDTDFYTNTVVRPDGTEREMTWSGTVIEVEGVEMAPAIFHETTPVRRAHRSAAEIVAGALADGPPQKKRLLQRLLAEAVQGNRVAAGFVLLQDPGSLRVAAQSGLDESAGGQVAASGAALADVPGGEDLLRGRSIYLSDGHQRYARAAGTASWVAVLEGRWVGAAQFPLWRQGSVVGCLVLLLTPRITSPSESELAFWSSLADQASVVLGTEAVRRQASESSARTERNRIARELHDSVSQGLFSLQAHAQAVQRALAVGDVELATQAAAQLDALARQATVEMRALVTDLRPDALPAPDLAETLHELVERVSRRDRLDVQLTVSPVALPSVPAATAEHVCRIVGEALHNVAKHARVSTAEVNVTAEDDRLVLRVRDQGAGFDAALHSPGFGRHTMQERAALCGGELRVVSALEAGTTVELTVPLPPIRLR